jgi:hypothetical protein
MRFASTSLTTLRSGDIIRVRRLFYWHYGVYNNVMEVIHFTNFPNNLLTFMPEVKITTISEFLLKSQKVECLCGLTYQLPVILENAYMRLGEQGYSLLRNNCKHFILSCLAQN